jgi:hypothetical protein
MVKKLFYTICLFLLAFPAFSFAQNLAGNYEREKDFMDAPSVLILKADGNFEISTGATSVRGTYTVADGKINFTDIAGDYPDTMATPGVYSMELTDGKLIFKAIKDKAIQRRHVLTASNWKRMKD